MHKEKTIEDLCQFIWYLEDKYKLIDFEIDNVKVWQYIRINIYYTLAKKLNLLENPNSSQFNIRHIFKNFYKIFKNLFIYSPFLLNRQIDNIVFPSQRFKFDNGEYIEIYTKPLIDELKIREESYIEIEKAHQGLHVRKRKDNIYYNDIILLGSSIYGKVYKIKEKDKLLKVNKIENEILENLHIKIDLCSIFRKNIARFIINYKSYKYIFLKTKPKKIYLVAGYAYLGDMIKAAKDLNIKTIEIQHGVISKYHLGYNFPIKEKLDYYPDKFLSWGLFWNRYVKNSFQEVSIVGFKHFNTLKNNYNGAKKVDNKVIILSQTALGSKIMSETLNIINLLTNYQIVYKLHPNEYSIYKNYKDYEKLSTYNNIVFLTDCDLYTHLSESTYQIGVFSTALFEGIAFGCSTYLFDLPGIEYMEDLIHEQYACIINGHIIFRKIIKTQIFFQ